MSSPEALASGELDAAALTHAADSFSPATPAAAAAAPTVTTLPHSRSAPTRPGGAPLLESAPGSAPGLTIEPGRRGLFKSSSARVVLPPPAAADPRGPYEP